MKRSRKKYETPGRPFDKQRIEVENKLMKAYGLKTKKDLWVMEALLRKYRRLARELAAKKDKEREILIVEKMIKLGLINQGSHLDDILGMNINNVLERRLQTVVFRKGIANSVNHARQLIVHGKISVEGKKVKYPSYITSRDEEAKLQNLSTESSKVTKNA